jgi:hypothetical protein
VTGAVRHAAFVAESRVVIEPGRADLTEAQREPERLGDPPGFPLVDRAAAATVGRHPVDDQVPLPGTTVPLRTVPRRGRRLLPRGWELAWCYQLDPRGGGPACGAGRRHDHRLGHLRHAHGLPVFPFPDPAPDAGFLAAQVAGKIEAPLDGLLVQDPVAARDRIPHPGRAQLRHGSGRPGTPASRETAWHEPRMAVDRGIRCRAGMKVKRRERHSLPGAGPRDGLACRGCTRRILPAGPSLAAGHRLLPGQQRRLTANSLTGNPGSTHPAPVTRSAPHLAGPA